jgi:DNA primase catalytic core
MTPGRPAAHRRPRGEAAGDDAAASGGASELVAVMDAAAEVWRSHARCASSYLRRRGLHAQADDPDRFGVGYAPQRPSHLIARLRVEGFDDEALLAAGVATRTPSGRHVDTFRGRLMFPILHHGHGRVVGAIGRDLTGRPGAPRYLNSPATPIFAKGQVLYGLAEQRDRLANGGVPTIVEGPLDALALRSLPGNLVPVALCGTALTATQAETLEASTVAEAVVLAFDSDPAGGQAAVQALRLVQPHFPRVLHLPLKYGRDPASAVSMREIR